MKKGILQKLENPNIEPAQQKQDVYSQLLDIKDARGYSDGWVAHKYRAIFEVWPRKMLAVRKPASEELKKWVTSQNIRYAKRRTP